MKEHNFSSKLKSLRERAGLTQNELEIVSEIPLGVVSFYETGSRSPGLQNIKALCKGLGCTASELLGF